jgi:hypothetical protein
MFKESVLEIVRYLWSAFSLAEEDGVLLAPNNSEKLAAPASSYRVLTTRKLSASVTRLSFVV